MSTHDEFPPRRLLIPDLMGPETPPVPAGYYPDPNTGHARWWDGHQWGDYDRAPQQFAAPVAPVAPVAGPPATISGEGHTGLVVAGYILAILMPLIGFILGIVTVTRPGKATSKQGVWIIVLSIVAFFGWLFVIAAAAQHGADCSTYGTYC